MVSPKISIMDQTKMNVKNTSLNNGKESSPFSSGSTTPKDNSNSITWFVSQLESSKFSSFWYQRFNLWLYDVFIIFLSCLTWKVNLFHSTFFQNAYQLLNQSGECPLVLKNVSFFFFIQWGLTFLNIWVYPFLNHLTICIFCIWT